MKVKTQFSKIQNICANTNINAYANAYMNGHTYVNAYANEGFAVFSRLSENGFL